MSTKQDPATEFLELFSRTRRFLSLVVWQEFGRIDLGPQQVVLMRELAKRGAASQAELARATLTDPAATSRALQTLVALRWVRRTRSEHDDRALIVEMTPSGVAASRRIEAAYRRAAKMVSRTLDARDLADFRRVANKVITQCGVIRTDCQQLDVVPSARRSRRA